MLFLPAAEEAQQAVPSIVMFFEDCGYWFSSINSGRGKASGRLLFMLEAIEGMKLCMKINCTFEAAMERNKLQGRLLYQHLSPALHNKDKLHV